MAGANAREEFRNHGEGRVSRFTVIFKVYHISDGFSASVSHGILGGTLSIIITAIWIRAHYL